jgi:acetyl esterase/lipase
MFFVCKWYNGYIEGDGMIKRYEQSKSMHVALGVFRTLKKVSGKTMIKIQLTTGFDSKYYPRRHYELNVIDDVKVYSRLNENSDKHLFYFHGGAYVFRGAKIHYQFLNDVYEDNEINIHYVDYPLAPEFIYTEITEITVGVVNKLIDMFHVKHVYLAGDSAGGNLALQVLKQIDQSLYRGLLGLSPWLDVSMVNEGIDEVEEDLFLDLDSVLKCAVEYTGGDINVKEASPIHSDYSMYPNMEIYIGTYDILYPDTVLFEEKNPNITLHIYKDNSHVFPLIRGTEELKILLEDVKKWLEN